MYHIYSVKNEFIKMSCQIRSITYLVKQNKKIYVKMKKPALSPFPYCVGTCDMMCRQDIISAATEA